MQMSVTFNTSSAEEAQILFSAISDMLARTKTAFESLLKPTSEPAVAQIEKTALEPTQTSEEPASFGEEVTELKKPRAPRGSAKKVDKSEAMLSVGREKVSPPAAEEAPQKTVEPDTTERSIDDLRGIIDRIFKQKGKDTGGPAILKALEKFGAKRLPELAKDKYTDVYNELKKIELDDEIPF